MSDSMKPIAVVLAGGLGIRLRQSVGDKPKVLAPVNGRPFLSYLLDKLDNAGIRKVVLCTGYMGAAVEEALGYGYKNLVIDYSKENEQLGTAGALKLAEPQLGTEEILVMKRGLICRIQRSKFLSVAQKKKRVYINITNRGY